MIETYYNEDGITLYCGDCREILPTFPDKSFDLCLTDPPYGIGKAEWDRVNAAYVGRLLSLTRTLLADNGTLWFFHMVFSDLAEIHQLLTSEGFVHKQLITLNKGIKSIAGRTSSDLRSFPRATEYLQFYTLPDPTGAEQLSDTYATINPMAAYLKTEIQRSGKTNKEIAALFPSKTGGLTGCVSNWLLGMNFPLREQYEKMRECLGSDFLRREYEDLRREYEDLRYKFTVPPGVTDVWDIDVAPSNGHETPKPILPVMRILGALSAAQTILDPFCGSGTTLVAAKQLGRKAVGIEISEKYCEIAVKRLSQMELFADPKDWGERPV